MSNILYVDQEERVSKITPGSEEASPPALISPEGDTIFIDYHVMHDEALYALGFRYGIDEAIKKHKWVRVVSFDEFQLPELTVKYLGLVDDFISTYGYMNSDKLIIDFYAGVKLYTIEISKDDYDDRGLIGAVRNELRHHEQNALLARCPKPIITSIMKSMGMESGKAVKEAVEKLFEREKILPTHFSILSAQKGLLHDEEAHKSLLRTLTNSGFKNIIPVDGHYGNPEKSVIVVHTGSAANKKKLENIALNIFDQESIIHSDDLKNVLVYNDGQKLSGAGIEIDDTFSDFYTVLPNGIKFRLGINHFSHVG